MSAFRKNRRFQMERLETRQMMAGDIHAFMQDGTLFINEDSGSIGGAQNVTLVQKNGSFELSSFTSNANPTGSRINGSFGPQTFHNVREIKVNLGAGQDVVGVIGTGATNTTLTGLDIKTSVPNAANDNDVVFINNLRVNGIVGIRTGVGQDEVSIHNSTFGAGPLNQSVVIDTGVITAAGDSDSDVVLLSGVKTLAYTTINTGASRDLVTVTGSTLGTLPLQTAMITTGAGSDTVRIGTTSNQPGKVTVHGNLIVNTGHDSENDADMVQLRDVEAFQSVFVELGGGNDRLDMINVKAGLNITLDAMSGDDAIALGSVEAVETVFARMGAGSDTLTIVNLKAKRAELHGGAGTDSLSITQSPEIGSQIRTGFERINGRLLPGPNLPVLNRR